MLKLERECRKDEERENKRWKPVLDKLRRKQRKELSQSERSLSAKPPLIRRLFFGSADIEVGEGFRRPQNRGFPKPLPDETAMVAVYVFARTRREAARRFRDGLSSDGYKVTKITDVRPHSSSRPMPMDNRFVRPKDVLRAWDTEEVLYGWFM